jgi:SAM-dependent methyltransferase
MLRVKDETIWGHIRILFLASALLFLANIYFGFDNALTAGALPRWQILVHLHAGTLGWVTLSAIGLMYWFLTGERDVTEAHARRVKTFTWLAVAVFAGYVLSFGLAFGLGRPFFYLMPIFGVTSSLVIWTAAIFAISALRQQSVVTTTHILVTAGLCVAAIGSTMGVLLGLEYVVGFFIPGSDRVGSHAAVMDGYLLLVVAAIVEYFLGKGPAQRWTWAGLALASAWSLSGILVIPGLLFGSTLGLLFVPLLLLGLIIFLVRSGWRAFRINPFGRAPQRWLFFGTLWAALWVLFYIYIGANYAQNIAAIPDWVGVIFQHASFVGTMTNLLLGVYSIRARSAGYVYPWGETAAIWLINLGLPLFLALEILADMRLGALLMGMGVLLGVLVMIVRLLLSDLSWVYDLLYRGGAPWEMEKPRPELMQMVESGRLEPCRAIDLDCGTGDNVIYLAQHGFDAVGVDLSPRAIAQARDKARMAGVSPTFVAGDVTDLKEVTGPFDLVLDYGCLGCIIGMPAREKYANTLSRLTRAGSSYILLNFAHNPDRSFSLVPNVLQPGEVDRLFGEAFEIEYYDDEHETGPLGMPVEFRLLRRK